MTTPRYGAKMSPKDREQTKHFDRKESETEYVSGRFESRCKHSGRHQRGIGGEGSGEFSCYGACACVVTNMLCLFTATAVIEEEDIDDHEPA